MRRKAKPMRKTLDFILAIYPADLKREFGDEMRAVAMTLIAQGKRQSWKELGWLLQDAIRERMRQQESASVISGALAALIAQLILYSQIIPIHRLRTVVLLLSLGAAIATSQQQPRQDPAALAEAKAIYDRVFKALGEARTIEDMQAVSESFDTKDWTSITRFGRTNNRELIAQEWQSMLKLKPEQRVPRMEIIWTDQDGDRMTVVAWMMPNEVEQVDSQGDYGEKGQRHKLSRATLVRDLFTKTPA